MILNKEVELVGFIHRSEKEYSKVDVAFLCHLHWFCVILLPHDQSTLEITDSFSFRLNTDPVWSPQAKGLRKRIENSRLMSEGYFVHW